MKRPECPNDWMSWFDKLVNRFAWWLCFGPFIWEGRARKWLIDRWDTLLLRMYCQCRRLADWAADRGKVRVQKHFDTVSQLYQCHPKPVKPAEKPKEWRA